MRSKSEILKIATSGGGCAYYDGTVYDGEVGSIEDAMDLFAQEVAIEFAKWCMQHTAQDLNTDNNWKYGEDLNEYTDEQLFNQFLQEIKQDK